MVAHDIIANGDHVKCAPLINFIWLSCTLQVAADTASMLAMGPFNVPLINADFTWHRVAVVQHNLPGLNQTPTMAAGQAIAASVSELVTEQQAQRQDMADRAENCGNTSHMTLMIKHPTTDFTSLPLVAPLFQKYHYPIFLTI
jgi:hypothetical protein